MSRIVNALSTALAIFGGGLIVLAAIVAVGNALSRGLFGLSIYGANDYLTMITFIGITACFPLAMRQRVHMRVTVLGGSRSKPVRIAIEMFASLLTLLFLVALAVRFFRRAVELGRYDEVTEIAGLVLAPWWWVAAGMLVAAVAVQIWVLFDDPRHYARLYNVKDGARSDD